MLFKNIFNKKRKNEIVEIEADVTEFDAMILWTLHDVFRFGPERLWKFYSKYIKNVCIVADDYSRFENVYTDSMTEYGIDIKEWREDALSELALEEHID